MTESEEMKSTTVWTKGKDRMLIAYLTEEMSMSQNRLLMYGLRLVKRMHDGKL